jgi:hypothetical protein
LNWNKWVRQIHRWLSVAFTVAVIANFIALGRGEPPAWVIYSPLLPLALLLFTACTCSCCHMPPSGEALNSDVRPQEVPNVVQRTALQVPRTDVARLLT